MPNVASLIRFLLCLTALRLAVHTQAQIVLSDFNSAALTTDGWQKYSGGDGGSSVTWSASGGDGDSGCLVLNDAASGQNDYFAAPAKFLGDQSIFYGGTLGFDFKITSSVELPVADNVILSGNGISIACALPVTPVTTGFTTYSLSLLPSSGWYMIGTTIAPTQTQMQGLLTSLTDLRILADWHNGPESDILDNVHFAAIPEPNTGALLFLGCGALAFAGNARRRLRRD